MVSVIIVAIDKVFNELGHGHIEDGGVADEFDPVVFVQHDMGFSVIEGTVRTEDSEVLAVLFHCSPGADHIFSFIVGEFADLLLVGFPLCIVDEECCLSWFLHQLSVWDGAHYCGLVRVIVAYNSVLQIFVVCVDVELRHIVSYIKGESPEKTREKTGDS